MYNIVSCTLSFSLSLPLLLSLLPPSPSLLPPSLSLPPSLLPSLPLSLSPSLPPSLSSSLLPLSLPPPSLSPSSPSLSLSLPRYANLERLAEDRRQRLEESKKRFVLSREMNELKHWITDKVNTIIHIVHVSCTVYYIILYLIA